jgi:hypothetical protein
MDISLRLFSSLSCVRACMRACVRVHVYVWVFHQDEYGVRKAKSEKRKAIMQYIGGGWFTKGLLGRVYGLDWIGLIDQRNSAATATADLVPEYPSLNTT